MLLRHLWAHQHLFPDDGRSEVPRIFVSYRPCLFVRSHRSYLAAAGLPRLHAKWSFRTLILVAGFCYTLPLAFLASVPGLWLCAVPLFVSGAAQGLSLPIINDNVALLGTPDDRAAILAVSETSVRVSQSVSPLLFSIISMKWLWDGAYASGFAVGILILLVAFFVFEPRTAPSQK